MKYLYLDKPAYDPENEILIPDYKIEGGTFVSSWKIEKKPDEDGYVMSTEQSPISE